MGREHGFSDGTICNWKAKDGGFDASEAGRLTFADDRKIDWHDIAPRTSPSLNGITESFKGRLLDGLLPETLSPSLNHARATLAAWRRDCNTECPHSLLGWRTLAELAETLTPQRGLALRNPHNSAQRPVAQPARIRRPSSGHPRCDIPRPECYILHKRHGSRREREAKSTGRKWMRAARPGTPVDLTRGNRARGASR
ncbi:transposase [Halovulum dunhuangense]|uniref:Transposase n=1 Tax=Halovulum dunhuangense TaxID=1505036 RepID=A0A849L895_9RHOB|nr:transposase [Halovulum dunhuangense]